MTVLNVEKSDETRINKDKKKREIKVLFTIPNQD